jgi:phosphatidylserine/phosphatidylglycerophosphate/cardiolipin synthase-like enzyme
LCRAWITASPSKSWYIPHSLFALLQGITAQNRGVAVNIILDKSQEAQRYSAMHFFLKHHIPVWIDYKPTIAHNKIIIVDEATVITGSFNFTNAAEHKNAENLLIIHDPELAQKYLQNWEKRRNLSVAKSCNRR